MDAVWYWARLFCLFLWLTFSTYSTQMQPTAVASCVTQVAVAWWVPGTLFATSHLQRRWWLWVDMYIFPHEEALSMRTWVWPLQELPALKSWSLYKKCAGWGVLVTNRSSKPLHPDALAEALICQRCSPFYFCLSWRRHIHWACCEVHVECF